MVPGEVCPAPSSLSKELLPSQGTPIPPPYILIRSPCPASSPPYHSLPGSSSSPFSRIFSWVLPSPCLCLALGTLGWSLLCPTKFLFLESPGARVLLPCAGNEAQSLKVFTYPPPGLLWGLRRLDPSRDYKAHSLGLLGGSDGTGDRYLWGKWFISLASLSTISALYSLPHCMQPCTCFPWPGVTEA